MKLLTISATVRLGFFLFDILFLRQTTTTCACRFIDGETWRLFFLFLSDLLFDFPTSLPWHVLTITVMGDLTAFYPVVYLISPPPHHPTMTCLPLQWCAWLDSFWSNLLFNIPATPPSYHDMCSPLQWWWDLTAFNLFLSDLLFHNPTTWPACHEWHVLTILVMVRLGF